MSLKIEMYEELDDLPIVRKQKHDFYTMLDLAVGSSKESVAHRVSRASQYFQMEEQEAGLTELANVQLGLSMLEQGTPPDGLAFAVMVKSINGTSCDDITERGLLLTLHKLNELGLTHKKATEIIEASKKKSKRKWMSSFQRKQVQIYWFLLRLSSNAMRSLIGFWVYLTKSKFNPEKKRY